MHLLKLLRRPLNSAQLSGKTSPPDWEMGKNNKMEPGKKQIKYTPPPQLFHNESLPGQMTIMGRETKCVQSAHSLTLVQRLQAIPNGAPGNHEQATKELTRVKYDISQSIPELSDKQQVECHAIYRSKTELEASAYIIFERDTWRILNIRRDEKIAFYMNDLVRQMCVNTMKKSSFDISNPSCIIGRLVKNAATINQLALNSKASGRADHKIDTLTSSPLGKLLQRTLQDFNFHADYYSETEGYAEDYLIPCSGNTPPDIYVSLKKNDSHPVN